MMFICKTSFSPKNHINILLLAMRSFLLVLFCWGCGSSVNAIPLPSEEAQTQQLLHLTILHTNDVHSRFLQSNKFGGKCEQKDLDARKCYGGFPRLYHKVEEIRRNTKNVLYLSGGDYYQGTVWYTLYKWRVISHFVNKLNHTAMAFGNHEFDDGVEGLVPFVERATFPLIAANIYASGEPALDGKFSRSVVLQVDGVKVGIIGYTTVETVAMSNTGRLVFRDVVDSVREEAERLESEGVKVLIALGHAGYEVDKLIGEGVPQIDLVVGGHTNTFLYDGTSPDPVDTPVDLYPKVVVQPGGKRVPIVQAYAYGKYLGYLNLTVDRDGEVVGWSGNPILLDYTVPQDADMLAEVELWGVNVTQGLGQVVGTTRVFLNGTPSACRLGECNLINLVTDAMIKSALRFSEEGHWADVTMGVINGGAVRGSIDERLRGGNITMEDVLEAIPFQNTIDIVEIRGKDLKFMLELSVRDYNPNVTVLQPKDLPGRFLQVSGMRVVYDVTRPAGARVKSVKVTCSSCRIPTLVDLEDETVYKVAMGSYIASGGDGYNFLSAALVSRTVTGVLDSDMVVDYIKGIGPVTTGIQGRITFEVEQSCGDPEGELLRQGLILATLFN